MAEPVTTGAEAAHGGGAFPPFQSETFASQLFWLAVTFALLYWFLAKVALPRIGGIIALRHDKIQGDLREAIAAKKEAEAAGLAYEAALSDAKSRSQAIAAETHQRLKAETDAKRRELDAALAEKLAAAEKVISETKSAALTHVEGIATDTADAILQRVLGNKPPQEQVSAAVKTALKG
ncbi:F0F1 ATP synthase subunit B family protein [Chelatococcus asaccharovorans]|uniref:ATP synthase subunit b n=1 Tax=Chelatococcus asaccharovorans TaxID=28210 RepID=A0A2V3U1Z2_9HYPH|nr:ATP F0F1 synthase subunit B' [Chelatococcus asaccharovorans]MBS7702301.1 ATP F0F1 synthase subunit B [Chelatococcus asaccharovorans]PXW56497.1 F-type H+-transporting ATPase subunit b [Chelatococcus asaccharovorans]CAH1669413.1 ATP synthase subunit b 2 [Chelatococcus asaccharovorans]CAH1679133.1 ATP synthase subunit b 2 [Chelatococcus asaccharovorans]